MKEIGEVEDANQLFEEEQLLSPLLLQYLKVIEYKDVSMFNRLAITGRASSIFVKCHNGFSTIVSFLDEVNTASIQVLQAKRERYTQL